jgi:Mg-chelatase subunit ChlD
MEQERNKNKNMKTKVFNVVILDKSGSMERIREAAVSGFNETLNGIKKAQEKYAETQEHFVTLVAFCSCETKVFFDKTPAADASPLTMKDYEPCCCTPLYDAMGFTLTSMRKDVREAGDAVVLVTVITDGLENASREYTGPAIKKLVEELKGDGWTFTYMGANQNSSDVAFNMSIRNSRDFDYSSSGTQEAMRKESRTKMNFFKRLNDFGNRILSAEEDMSLEEKKIRYSQMADEAFDEEESKG